MGLHDHRGERPGLIQLCLRKNGRAPPAEHEAVMSQEGSRDGKAVRSAAIFISRGSTFDPDLHTMDAIHEITMIIQKDPAAIDDRNSEGSTALMIAAFNGNIKLVHFLLDRGASVDLSDQDGTALDIARTKNHTGCVALLEASARGEELPDLDYAPLEWHTVKCAGPEARPTRTGHAKHANHHAPRLCECTLS